MSAPTFLPLTTYRELSAQEMAGRAKLFRGEMLRAVPCVSFLRALFHVK